MRTLLLACVASLFLSWCAALCLAEGRPNRVAGCLRDRGHSKVSLVLQSDRRGHIINWTVDPPQAPVVATCIDREVGRIRTKPHTETRHTLVVVDFPSGPRLK